MTQKSSPEKVETIPLYPLRSESKLNQIPKTMFSNAKSLVQNGYFVISNQRIEKKREKIGLPERKESTKYIEKLLQGERLKKLVGEE
ncbi:MAG: hypothetical protein ACFFB2_15335 [Promethearchaeota archaeon]